MVAETETSVVLESEESTELELAEEAVVELEPEAAQDDLFDHDNRDLTARLDEDASS